MRHMAPRQKKALQGTTVSNDGETVWGDRVQEELRLVPGGGHHGGAVASWAAVYRRGRPIVVEPLHGSLRGPPREETHHPGFLCSPADITFSSAPHLENSEALRMTSCQAGPA